MPCRGASNLGGNDRRRSSGRDRCGRPLYKGTSTDRFHGYSSSWLRQIGRYFEAKTPVAGWYDHCFGASEELGCRCHRLVTSSSAKGGDVTHQGHIAQPPATPGSRPLQRSRSRKARGRESAPVCGRCDASRGSGRSRFFAWCSSVCTARSKLPYPASLTEPPGANRGCHARSGCRFLGRPGGESWFATLKTELIHRQSWPTKAQARRAIFEFVEVFYNRQRLHSSLNCLTPLEFEQSMIHHHRAAHAA